MRPIYQRIIISCILHAIYDPIDSIMHKKCNMRIIHEYRKNTYIKDLESSNYRLATSTTQQLNDDLRKAICTL